MTSDRNYKLRTLIEEAIDDGINLALERTAELKAKGFDSLYLPKHENFPSVSNFSSGLPYFTTTPAYFGFKISYNKILSDSKKDIELQSWKILLDYFMNDERLYEFINWKDWNPPSQERKNEMLAFSVLEDLRSLIDSIIHSSKSNRVSSKIKNQKIINWVNALTRRKVDYDLIIPIIFYQPDCRRIEINKSIRIQKLSKEIQLSRHNKLPENIIAHKDVVGAATHGIIISNIIKDIPNENQWEKYKIIKQKIDENFDLILKLFSIIRLVVNDSIGFCQVIALPLGFEEHWFADLLSLKIFGYKKYPQEFENNGWHIKRLITKKQLGLIRKYFNQNVDDKKVKLAKRKLFDSDLRISKDDSVLDIATGLEALLSDSTDNLRYKISLRSAIVCKKKKLFEFTPIEIRDGIKTFYDFRSAIIHGNTKDINKMKEIKLDRFEPINTLWFGKSVLEHLIEFLIIHPEFNNIDNIDNYFLK